MRFARFGLPIFLPLAVSVRAQQPATAQQATSAQPASDPQAVAVVQAAITGVDDAGLQFAEQSRLEDFGDLACRFSMRNAVHQDAILGVEPLGTDGQNFREEFSRVFTVIWVSRKNDRLMVGARSLREDELSDADNHTTCSASSFSEK
jgi:hypothetical protein